MMLFELPPKANLTNKDKEDKSRLLLDLWNSGWRYDGSYTEKIINQTWQAHDSWNVFKSFIFFPKPTTKPIEAPSNLTLAQGGSVAENSANGTVVGKFSGYDDQPGQVLTYQLLDNAGGRFAMNPFTGMVTVADGSLLDYEVATAHSIRVRVTNSAGLSIERVQTISLTNVNETPNSLTLASGGSVAENSANGTVVATFAGTDPDAGTNLEYSLQDNAGGRFAINSSTGEVTVANSSLLDFENLTTHNITVRVSDGTLTRDLTQVISVTNVNEAPNSFTLTQSNIVLTNPSFESLLAGWTTSGHVHAFSAQGSSQGVNAVGFSSGDSLNNGVISQTISTEAGMSYQLAFSHGTFGYLNAPQALKVDVISNGANVFSQTFHSSATTAYSVPWQRDSITFTASGASTQIIFSDVSTVTASVDLMLDNIALLALGSVTPSVAENSSNGTFVATFAGTDPDAGTNLEYTLQDNAGGRFAINSSTGEVTVADGSLLNFENLTTHNLTVRVTDGGGLTRDLTQAITVTNVNEAPNTLTLSSGGSVAENSANGTVVATFAGTDPDAGTNLEYTLQDNAGGRFAINSSTGEVTVADGSLLNFENLTTHNLTVRVTDGGGLTRDLTQAITVTNVNEAPNTLTLSSGGSVAENSANGTVVATFAGTDPDAGTNLEYTLQDNANGRFAINSSTGEVTVADGSLLNFETNTTHNITVRVSDGTLTRDLTQAISVTNVNEAPDVTRATLGDNLLINGSFENLVSLNQSYGYSGNQLQGWVLSGAGSVDQFQGYGITATHGTYSLDLDSYGGNTTISQKVNNLPVGSVYQLSLDTRDFLPNGSSGDTLQIFWGGQLVGTIQDTVVGGDWKAYQYSVTAGAGDGSDTLRIVASGPTDLAGMILDNIQLRRVFGQSITPITVLNPGFEAQTLANGGFSYTVPNWGPGGLDYNPQTAQMSTQATQGFNTAVTGVGVNGNLSQVLSETLTSNTIYTLAVDVGSRNDVPLSNNAIRLYAGNTLLTEVQNIVPPSDNWTTGVLTFDSSTLPVNSALFGQALRIELASTNGSGQTIWDNVRLAKTIVGADSVAENSANGTVVAMFTGTDPDAGTNLQYSLQDNAGGRFAINATTGVVTVANSSLLDFETNTTHNLTVRVTDWGGLTRDLTQAINVTNVNEAPTDLILSGTTTSFGSSAFYNATYDKWYAINNTSLTWEAAMDAAQYSFLNGVSGTLSTARSSTENSYIFSLSSWAWLGGSDKLVEGQWLWYQGDTPLEQFSTSSGNSVAGSFVNWSSTPNGMTAENYAHYYPGAVWNDRPGSSTLRSVVQWDGAAVRAAQAIQNGGATTSIKEDATAGTVVGTLSGTDVDAGSTFTYAITGGSSASKFTIVGNELRVASGATFDYETSSTETVTLAITDNGGLTRSETFTVNVVNVNEAPNTLTLASGGSIAENSANGTVVATFTGSDLDAGDNAGLRYSLANSAGGCFAINATTGVVTVANSSLLDFENLTTHNITVRVTDGGGLTRDLTQVITVTNVNEAPNSLTLASGGSVAENSANGIVVATFAGTDPDAGTNLEYSLQDNAGGRFAINSSTGEVTVADGSLLNFENLTTHNLTVRVTDGGGLTRDLTQAITVTNVNEAPDNLMMVTGSELIVNGGFDLGVGFDPGSTATGWQGTYLGRDNVRGHQGGAYIPLGGWEGLSARTLSQTVTTEIGKTYELSFYGNSVAGSGSLLVETLSSGNPILSQSIVDLTPNSGYQKYTFIFTATSTSTEIKITDTSGGFNDFDVDDFLLKQIAGNVLENSANGTVVATFAGTDPDAGTNLEYSLQDNAGGRFAINSSTGEVTVANSSLLDFENLTTHNLTVRVTDGGGLTRDLTQAITVTNVNEAPNTLTLASGGSIAENSANGTVVATFAGTDPDAGTNLEYTLQDNAGGRFAINSSTGEVTVANSSLLDFENLTTHNLTVRVTDGGGLTRDLTQAITLTNVNEAPNTLTLASGGSVAENSANGIVVATFAGTDPDAGTNLEYTLQDNAGGRFAINSSTGEVTVADGSLLNFETNTTHNLTVRVTDGGGLTRDLTQAITVTNVNEAPTDLILSGTTTSLGSSAFYNATYDKWYAINNTSLTWEAAMDAAQFSFLNGVSGTLVNVANASERTYLFNSMANEFWIGGSDKLVEGQWLWYQGDVAGVQFSNGSTAVNGQYAPWAGGQPDNWPANAPGEDYAMMRRNGDINWQDIHDTYTMRSIMQWDGAAVRAAQAVQSGGATTSIKEDATAGTVVGTLSGTDVDAGSTFTYTITGGSSASKFTIVGNELRVASSATFDYETSTTETVTLTITDNGGLTRSETFTVNVVNVNEAPNTLTLASGGSIAENSANGTVVATFAGTDPDAGAGLLYSLTDNAGGRFAINATTGAVRVADNTLLNFEANTTHNITVRTTDIGGLTRDLTQAITVTNVGELPTLLLGEPETFESGATTGWSNAANVNSGSNFFTRFLTDSLTYGASGDASAVSVQGQQRVHKTFALSGNQTQVTITFEMYEIDSWNGENFQVWLNDVLVSNRSYNNALTETYSDSISTTSLLNQGFSRWNDQKHTYTLVVNTTATSLKLGFGSMLNSAWSDEAWAIDNVYLREDVVAIAENSANGTVVATFSGVDGETANNAPPTYSLVSPDGRFAINSSTGVLTVADSSLLNFEASTSHTVTVRATGATGLTRDLVQTVNILNVNEAPNVLGLVTGDNLLINPSFENLYTVNKSGEWNGYDDGTILQGWVREAGNFDQIDNYTLPSAPNAAPTHGNYFLDLEGSSSNQLAISQTVSGLTAGSVYQLSFDTRDWGTSSGDSVSIYWGGQLLQTITDAMTGYTWNTYRYQVTAGAGNGSNTLRIVGAGPSDGNGMAVDNFSLRQVLPAMATSIAIANAGFDQQTVTDGASGFGNSVASWVGNGSIANPATSQLPTLSTNGDNVAHLLNGRSLSQTLTETLATNTLYTLSVNVGDRVYFTVTNNAIRLYAGTTLLGVTLDVIPPTNGSWQTAVLRFDSTTLGVGSSLYGQALKIELENTATSSSFVWFDDVRLTKSPASAVLGAIAENSANGTVVATFAGTDPDAGTNLTYSLVAPTGAFAINSSTGVLTVLDSTKLDFESATTHSVTVRISDGTLTRDLTQTINVTDVIGEVVTGTYGNDTLRGGIGNDTLSGNYSGNDVLYGGDGNDVLYASTLGADTLYGGLGNDTYYLDTATQYIIENTNEGNDTVYFSGSVNYTLANNVENLISWTNTNRRFDGNSLNNLLYGNSGNDTLYGGLGDDTLQDGIGTGNDALYGESGNDVLYASGGNDSLDGGTGVDTMAGGTGDDTYFVDDASDVVTESSNEGTDEVRVTGNFNYTLANNIENGRISYVASATNLTGNALNNTLYGNAFIGGVSNVYGGAGDDSLYAVGLNALYGEDGNDRLDLSNLSSLADGGQGNDTIYGGSGSDTIYGADGDDYINTSSGANLAYGGVGTDTIYGGSGNDTLYGDDGDDYINTSSGANLAYGGVGTDTIYGGSGNDTLYGDDGDDYINTSSGANLAYAGVGADTIYGGSGNDTLYGDDGNDYISTSGGANLAYAGVGADTIYGGSGNDTLYGDDGNDYISTSSGNDSLDGGLGADTMLGGAGDDTYYVDSVSDTVTEYSNDGIDTVVLTGNFNYSLANHVENGTSLASAGFNLIGNSLNNVLYGSNTTQSQSLVYGGTGNDTLYAVGLNTLYGEDGNDTLYAVSGSIAYGGNHNDILYGGTGSSVLYGDAGNDTLTSAMEGDTLDGGDGDDVLISNVVENATFNTRTDTLISGAGNDVLVGGDFMTQQQTGNMLIQLGLTGGNDTLTGTQGSLTPVIAESVKVVVNDTDSAIRFAFNNAGTQTDGSSAAHSTVQVTLEYGSGSYSTLQYMEFNNTNNTPTSKVVDVLQVSTGNSTTSYYFTGQKIMQIYQAFLSYQSANPGVDISNLGVVRTNTDLMNIIATHSVSGVSA